MSLSIAEELELVRLSVDLGALDAGGPLADAEGALVDQAIASVASSAALTETARAMLLAGRDPLGEVFSALRPPRTRRARGQFWTPAAIVGLMVDWALAAGPTRLVDPGCGSGRFAAAAIRADPHIEVVAIDVDPLACLTTRAALAVLDAPPARVICDDYLTAMLPGHMGKTAWVGNPPYVRHHDLTPETKSWASRAGKRLGYEVSGLAGLHALFYLATMLHGRIGDVGTFVTSAEWLDVGYGSIIRGLLTNGMGVRALDLVDPKAVPFEDAMTTAVISCFELGRDSSQAALLTVGRPDELSGLGNGRLVSYSELEAAGRWSHLFRTERLAPHEGLILGDVARVHRGFVTGANDFFLMTRAEARARGLAGFVKPAITSASEILSSGGIIRDTPGLRVLLHLPPDLDRDAYPAVDDYLREGERKGVDRRYVPSHRKPWWRVQVGNPAPIVASYMARQAPRFARNPDGLALLNIGHGIHPRFEMTNTQLDELVAELNARRPSFTGSGRTYHGGLEKFEPREMEALPIPDTLVLSPTMTPEEGKAARTPVGGPDSSVAT